MFTWLNWMDVWEVIWAGGSSRVCIWVVRRRGRMGDRGGCRELYVWLLVVGWCLGGRAEGMWVDGGVRVMGVCVCGCLGDLKGECRGGLMEVVRKSIGVVGWRLEMESRM